VLTEVTRDLKDSTLQKIIVFQDKQEKDSLIAYFKHRDPSYRYAAAMAFGSIKDSVALDSLNLLLKDPIQEVRVAAAYAIGQIGDKKGVGFLINAFEPTDSIFKKSNAAILEAVGKCGTEKELKLLSTISTYKPSDTLLLEGQAWGIYRFSLRGMTLPEGTSKILSFVNNKAYPARVRMIAANYLGRSRNIDIDPNVQALCETFKNEENYKIKMPLALAIGKINLPLARETLLEALQSSEDYRVVVNSIRGLKNANYDSVKIALFELADSSDLAIANTAAQFFVEKGDAKDATFYWRKAKENHPWQVQLAFYEAANKFLPPYFANYKKSINSELRRRFINAQIPHERAYILKILGDFGWNYSFLIRQTPLLKSPVEQLAVVQTVQNIVTSPTYDKTFGAAKRRVTRELGYYLLQTIKSGNLGGMAIAAKTLQEKNVDFKRVLQDSVPILKEALQSLKLPEATDTYNEIQNAIAYLEGGSQPKKVITEYNHPIDLDLLSKVTLSAGAVIQTDKGKIRLELFPLLAPGTVVNFIQLAESGYFKEKSFHRIVPNFVIQGASSNGDGSGGLDYTIRSELPKAYYDDEGYIGMASSGNHTESTQFFITHSPTPHLDGNYTIFGKVTDGMKAVNEMEIGDKIQSVAIRY
jgi:cyclophilin family peptidyl-prolyl cis-trans isomerase/HEAT repeat protein